MRHWNGGTAGFRCLAREKEHTPASYLGVTTHFWVSTFLDSSLSNDKSTCQRGLAIKSI
jgi:hypothetical protein